MQIHVSLWGAIGHNPPPLMLVGTGGKNLDEAFVKVVACSRLVSTTQEDLKRPVF